MSHRYYFLLEGPEDFDANFELEELVSKYNDFIQGFSTSFLSYFTLNDPPSQCYHENHLTKDPEEPNHTER